jgi:glycosyltransferase involved in cell wall biosynthesis
VSTMNICMLIWQYWPSATGGAESQCRKLTARLGSQGVRCSVLTSRADRNTAIDDWDSAVTVHRVPIFQNFLDWINLVRPKRLSNAAQHDEHIEYSNAGKVSYINRFVRRFNTLCFMVGAFFWLRKQRRQVDVIHVHIGEWLAGFGGWVGAMLGIPVVCKVADVPAFPPLERGMPFRQRLESMRYKVHYVALHDDIARELRAAGISPAKITEIPNGVELPSGQACPSEGEYVLCVGNLSQGAAHKGFDILFQAWARVCGRFPKARLKVVGGGDIGGWMVYVKDLGCAEHVEFTGYVSDIEPIYEQATLFVLASRHEGLSNALLEAQSYGLPAVVSDIPGNRAVVLDGVTGSIVPVGDVGALAEAICGYLGSPQFRDKTGVAARDRVRAHFSMAYVSSQYIALYKDCKNSGS